VRQTAEFHVGDISWAEIGTRFGRAERDLRELFEAVQEPWVLVQVAIILPALLASIPLGRSLERVLERRVRGVQGQPRLLRFLALLLRRTRWFVAAFLLGLANSCHPRDHPAKQTPQSWSLPPR
jgi:hypothetical protein